MRPDNKTAIEFFLGNTPDNSGAFVDSYFDMTEEEMESCHGWIQWAFPIDTVSQYNPHAVLIDDRFRDYVVIAYPSEQKNIDRIRDRLFWKYLRCLGISPNVIFGFDEDGGIEIETDVDKFLSVLDTPWNHHVKRLSRVLRHQMLARDEEKARVLLRALLKIALTKPAVFHADTVAYWCGIVYYNSKL